MVLYARCLKSSRRERERKERKKRAAAFSTAVAVGGEHYS